MCFGLAALAEPIVLGVLGAKWRDAVPLVRILSIVGLLQSITSLSTSLFLSQGRPDLHLRVTVVQSVTTIVAVLLGQRWGVTGVAAAYAVAITIVTVPILHLAGGLVGLTVTEVLARTTPMLAAGGLMFVVLLLVDGFVLEGAPPLERLGLGVALGVGVYAAAIRAGGASAYRDVMDLLRRAARAGGRSAS
jgi:O-antigen/teichoic acid export membrane protein